MNAVNVSVAIQTRLSRLVAQIRGQGLAGQLFRGGVGSLFIKVANTLLGLILAIVLARSLGVEGYGIYSYVFSFLSVLAVPAQLGLSTLVVRETARAQAKESWALMRGVWRWSGIVVVLFTAVLCALGAAIVWLFKNHFTEQQLATFWWGILLVPAIALGNVRGAALRGLMKVVQGQLPEFVLRPALFIAFVVFAVLAWPAEPLAPATAMMLHVIAGACAFVVGAVLLWSARPTAVVQTRTFEYEHRAWMASLVPLGLISAMQLTNKYTDILLLGFLGTAADVGVYRVSVQAATLNAFAFQAAIVAVAPHLSRIYAQGDMSRLQQVVTATSRALFLLGLPVTAVFLLFGKSLLTWVFGPEYAVGYLAMCLLCVSRLVGSMMGPVATLLSMSGHERITAMSASFGAVSNVVLNALLIPRYGLNGAAAATSLSFVAWHVIMWRVARTRLRIDTLPFKFSRTELS